MKITKAIKLQVLISLKLLQNSKQIECIVGCHKLARWHLQTKAENEKPALS